MNAEVLDFGAHTFGCVHMAGRRMLNAPRFRERHDSAYQLWRRVLVLALRSEGLEKKVDELRSDPARDQDEWVVLTMGDDAIGVIMLSWFDLHSASESQCSYLDILPSDIRAELVAQHRIVMSYSHVMLTPKMRRRTIGFGASDMLVDFCVQRFLETPATALIGYTRNNRSAHELFCRHGGRQLRRIRSHGLDSDIIQIGRDSARLTPVEAIRTQSQRLWSERTETFHSPELARVPNTLDDRRHHASP